MKRFLMYFLGRSTAVLLLILIAFGPILSAADDRQAVPLKQGYGPSTALNSLTPILSVCLVPTLEHEDGSVLSPTEVRRLTDRKLYLPAGAFPDCTAYAVFIAAEQAAFGPLKSFTSTGSTAPAANQRSDKTEAQLKTAQDALAAANQRAANLESELKAAQTALADANRRLDEVAKSNPSAADNSQLQDGQDQQRSSWWWLLALLGLLLIAVVGLYLRDCNQQEKQEEVLQQAEMRVSKAEQQASGLSQTNLNLVRELIAVKKQRDGLQEILEVFHPAPPVSPTVRIQAVPGDTQLAEELTDGIPPPAPAGPESIDDLPVDDSPRRPVAAATSAIPTDRPAAEGIDMGDWERATPDASASVHSSTGTAILAGMDEGEMAELIGGIGPEKSDKADNEPPPPPAPAADGGTAAPAPPPDGLPSGSVRFLRGIALQLLLARIERRQSLGYGLSRQLIGYYLLKQWGWALI